MTALARRPDADAQPPGSGAEAGSYPAEPVFAAIRANLMPEEVLRARGNRRAAKAAAVALVLSVLVVGALTALARMQTSGAREDLAAAEQRAATLIAGQAEFADLTTTQSQIAFVEDKLELLMAGDIRWAAYLHSITAAAPAGVAITGIDATIDDPGAGRAGAADRVGTVTLAGSAPTTAEVSAYVDALGQLPGVAGVYLSSVAVSEARTVFSITAVVTADAVVNRYAETAPAPAATTGGVR